MHSSTFRNVAWGLVFGLTIIAFVLRAYLASTMPSSGEDWFLVHNGFFLFALIVLLIYSLFVLEGLLHAVLQIRAADEGALEEFVKTSGKISDRAQRSVMYVVGVAHRNIEEIIIGRQMCSVFAIVLIALLFDKLQFDDKSPLINWLNTHYPSVGATLILTLNGFVVLFLCVTLLPCWMGQLFPQFLADNHGIEFIQRPLVPFYIAICYHVGRLGVGYPAVLLSDGYRRLFGSFTQPENVRLGRSRLFDNLAANYQHVIGNRAVKIEVSQHHVTLSDSAELEFRQGSTPEIRHVLKIRLGHTKSLEILDGIVRPPKGTKNDQPLSRLLKSDPVDVENDAAHRRNAPEFILSVEATLDKPPPLDEKAQVEVVYKTGALNVDRNVSDRYYFDISRPTRVLSFRIIVPGGMFLVQPNVFLQQSDELLLLDEEPRITPPDCRIEQVEDVWIVNIGYPPLGARILLELDARIPEAART
jgi:hypothetical protein